MTVDELSSTYDAEQSIIVERQHKATGRRCHKTLKGGGEAVWPPNLEAALIAGLQLYSEKYRVRMRHPGRFIGRNHFLSDYVESVTGKRRTHKQVGSRLQQLKDTCYELDILYLITGDRSSSPCRDHRQGSESSSKASSRRSISGTPELSDGASEESPDSHATSEYPPTIEISQSIAFPPTTGFSSTSADEPLNQIFFTNEQCNTIHFTPYQHYPDQDRWTCISQTSTLPSSTPIQQWGSYCSTAATQQQHQYAYNGY
ncbi:hypothetical protein NP233_g7439 [Leucocoprinus birnbaumii]|uniref:TEA domain-containing protein n=1 Tax=Leucocoprinus birnbaumii TaxID=56174 RepID=A0AAD5VUP0_9AGAR|nr:hypothetical protein NP233_g7439 [Leucocoprinus birnbaumii]